MKHLTEELSYVRVEDLPTEFSWANKDGIDYLTTIRNQHIPQYARSVSCTALHAPTANRLVQVLRFVLGDGLDVRALRSLEHCARA